MLFKIRAVALLTVFVVTAPVVVVDAGCCSQTFATCVNYCGTTQQECQFCTDTTVVWLANGVPAANTCIPRWSSCTSNRNSCCPGLTCVGDQYWAGCQYVSPSPVQPTATPITPTVAPIAPTVAPIAPTLAPIAPTVAPIAPTVAPVSPTIAPVQPTIAPIPPTLAPVTSSAAACCTQTFATCVNYCGTTQQQCNSCTDTTVAWLPQGVPPPNSCISRWSACTNNVNGCCPGLTCVGDQNYAGCQYVKPTTTTPPPTPAPVQTTQVPVAPTIAPVAPNVAPVAPTWVPVAPTVAPVAPTAAPVAPTLAPVAPTVAPVVSTTAPIQPTTAPVLPTPVPVLPTTAPVPPTSAPVASSGGCCTQTFATCVTYCGTTQQQCTSCSDTTVAWLPQGVPPANSCVARWNACTNNPSACCPGLTCVGDQNYAGCQYLSGPTPPPPPPTVPPTLVPVSPAPTAVPVVVPTLPPVPTPPTAPSPLFSTSTASSTWTVFQALSSLTAINSVNPPVYALLSSGGAAGSGNVVSEGQGYALFITGTVLASWNTHAQGRTASDRNQVLTAFYGYFNGWKSMCQHSSAPCQPNKLCQDASGTTSVCLPDWQFNSALTSPLGTGSAPDGEEDAIVGMILGVKAVANDSPRPSWYDEIRKWADASATAFLTYDTLGNDPSAPNQRLVKLGSCWGGWSSNGQNPSYHSPGAYKLMRDYQASFPNADRYTPATFTTSDWNALIQTSYKVLSAVQCPIQGMVPNWATVSYSSSTGTVSSTGGSFSGSGTPQYEFGAEASRTIWRVAVDAAFYPSQSTGSSGTFLTPLLKQLQTGYAPTSPPFSWQASTFTTCSAPNSSNNIYIFSGGWLYNAFIYAPIVSSLVVPLSTLSPAQQQLMINSAGVALQNNVPNDYYGRCWNLLGSLMVNGAIASAGVTALS